MVETKKIQNNNIKYKLIKQILVTVFNILTFKNRQILGFSICNFSRL